MHWIVYDKIKMQENILLQNDDFFIWLTVYLAVSLTGSSPTSL